MVRRLGHELGSEWVPGLAGLGSITMMPSLVQNTVTELHVRLARISRLTCRGTD